LSGELDQSVGTPDASAILETAPVATPTPDLEAITKSFGSQIDERFRGFQSLLDQKLDPLSREVNRLKTAQLSPEEQEQAVQAASDAEVQRLKTENAMLRLGQTQPEAVAFFQEIMSQPTLEAQLALIQGRIKPPVADANPAQEPATAGTAPAAGAPGNDANNPPRKPQPTLAGWNGEAPLTADQAAAVLNQFGDEKGALIAAREG
jgi:hypothetical protein